jgi:hypothetical protein
MAFPVNDLESALLAASQGSVAPLDFVTRLFQSEVVVLDLPSADGSRYLGTITMDDRILLPVFTSPEQAQLSGLLSGESQALAGVLRDIMSTQPTSWGVAVNPGGTLGLPVYAEAVQAQLARVHSIPVGTTVHLGAPAVEPTALLEQISMVAPSVPAIRSISRCWAVVGDQPPGLVIGVDLEPDTPDVRAIVLRTIDGARAVEHPDSTVDIVFWRDRGPFVEWMEQNATPFYRRGA